MGRREYAFVGGTLYTSKSRDETTKQITIILTPPIPPPPTHTRADHINMAARLMLVKGVDILCDHSTYTFTIENFDFRQHDLVVVKGRDDQMEVYEPVCRKVEAEKAQWNVSFVGRLEEKRKVIDCMYNKSIVTVSAPEGE